MGRKTDEELQKIMKKYNVDRIFSWSRYNSYLTSKYEYFLHYILHKSEDRCDCIYTSTGSTAHNIMEKLYSKEIKYEDMTQLFDDGWTTCIIADLKFDRNSLDKNEKIANKYYCDLQHFFRNHRLLQYKIEIERFIIVKVGDNLFQGYIDVCYKDKDGNYIILDWKTSSIYKGEKAKKECGQLLLYAIALNQLGIPFEKIKICWNFLKYVSVEVEQANGKKNVREIERCDIGNKLQSNVKMWLKKLGYEEQLVEYLDLLVQTNNIECLPDDVQQKYKIDDCYVFVNITDELINDLQNKIVETINEIQQKEKEYEVSKDNQLFWETYAEVEKQSYYFATLCAYSANLHLPYKSYLEARDLKKQSENNIISNSSTVNQDSQDDLAWLDEL